MLRNTADSWGVPAKFFHWVMAALILAQITLGVMAATWRVSPAKLELFFWHKSTGMLILALVALRHHFVKRNNVLTRMLPGTESKP